ncbi:MAG: type II toxin-antitoxin system RelB/DinJ family antitoxin [Paludibacteraceae bacterium]|nr:type II toxin-antitoxin system RelB/DinJ family antitoxin [Paludibacteraceae bacterium]
MSQTAFTVRLDSDIKQKFDSLCNDFGMSSATAFNIFARTVVKKRKIPFEIESGNSGWDAFREIRRKAMAGELPDLTLDEINEEIKLYREGK